MQANITATMNPTGIHSHQCSNGGGSFRPSRLSATHLQYGLDYGFDLGFGQCRIQRDR